MKLQCQNKNCRYTADEEKFVIAKDKIACPKCGYKKVEEVK